MDDWISARDALSAYQAIGDRGEAQQTIAKRAQIGLIEARAERLVVGDETRDNVRVHKTFWWAGGGQAMEANWNTGDFETWINGNHDPDRYWLKHGHATVRVIASGVSFSRSGIDALLPKTEPVDEPDSKPVSQTDLEEFHALFVQLNGLRGLEVTVDAAKAFFPGKTVTRVRVQDLQGPGKPGRPPNSAK